jgi:hypothetical protein
VCVAVTGSHGSYNKPTCLTLLPTLRERYSAVAEQLYSATFLWIVAKPAKTGKASLSLVKDKMTAQVITC